MADLRAYQPSFTAGELSPSLWSRVDLQKYQSGLKTAVNLFIHPHGGASNRAGLEFIREVKASAKKARLVPFQFNTAQSYILEFGDKYFRVFRDGGVILSGGLPYEVVTPYDDDHVGDIVYIQEADVMYLCHPLYPPHKISRLADDNWTITTVAFSPLMTAPTGLVGGARYKFRSGASSSVRIRVAAVAAGGASSAASSEVSVAYVHEHFDGRFVRASWNAMPGASFYRVYLVAGVGGGSGGLLGETPGTSFDCPTQSFSGDGSTIPGAADPGAPSTPTGVTLSIEFGKDQEYVVSAVNGETGEESLPSSSTTIQNDMSIAGNMNTLSWSAVAGADGYLIYRKDNGVYGYIGRSDTTTFTDQNITPDIADGPQIARNPFSGTGNYPRCAAFVEQRLAFFSTINETQGAWMSQSSNYENFGYARPSKPSDAVTFRIKSRQVNEIRSALAVPRGLLLLTSGAEWIVNGGSNSDAITPSAIKIENQGYRGAARVQPIVVGNTVLFAQDSGGVVRDFSYEFANDSFTGKDLTVLARHLFSNRKIVSWAYSQAPYSIAWVVLDDGSLVSLTYMKEHEVWGWTRHKSGPGGDAFFEDVSVIKEGNEDVPYFIVRRTIGGGAKRYIERLHTREFDSVEDAFFVDSGLTYTGTATTTISGLGHLNGQSVVALANGNVVRGLTVSSGSVTLPNAATKVHIGLPMEAALQTLSLDLGAVQGLGTVQGRLKSISDVTLRVEKTRGIFVGDRDAGRTSERLVEYKQREGEAWNEAIGLFTGDLRIGTPWDWNTNGDVWIKQFDPLPMTILAIMPDVVVGR